MKGQLPVFKRKRNMLLGSFKKEGFACWRHSFTARESVTGEEFVFFIDFFVVNPSLSLETAVFGQQADNRQNMVRPSYVMIKAGVFGKKAKQINNFYPLKELTYTSGTLDIQAGSCRLTEKSFVGSVFVSSEEAALHPERMSDAGKMRWDLQIVQKSGFFVKRPPQFFPFRRVRPMLWNPSGAKTDYMGTVYYDGREYSVIPEKSMGFAEKIGGRAFESPWLRISCAQLKSQFISKQLLKSCLLIGGTNILSFMGKKNFIPLVFLNYEGKIFEFTHYDLFKRAQTVFFSSQDAEYYNWSFSAKSKKYVLDIQIQCKKADILRLFYEQPDGKPLTLLSSATAAGEIKLYQKNGKILEALEHITVTNARCEFSNE